MTYLPVTPELSQLIAAFSDAGFTVEVAVRVGSDAAGWAEVVPGVEPELEPAPPFDPAAYYATISDPEWTLVDDATLLEMIEAGEPVGEISDAVEKRIYDCDDRATAITRPLAGTGNLSALLEWLNAQVEE